MTEKQAKELLNRACDIITSLEGYAEEAMTDYYGSYTQRNVDAFFNEVDMLNEEDTGPEYDSAGFTEEDRIVNGQYRTYVETVKRNIDQATEEGLLRDSSDYNYMQKETFANRMKTDKEFAAYWADQQAQDWDTFGEKKV